LSYNSKVIPDRVYKTLPFVKGYVGFVTESGEARNTDRHGSSGGGIEGLVALALVAT